MIRQAIIVAGGMGTRFDSPLPKQFVELAGKPVLFYSLLLFKNIAENIVLVLPKDQERLWVDLCKKHHFEMEYSIAYGGITRTESVKNGLNKLPVSDSVVAIHDAVRPLASTELVKKLYDAAEQQGSAIPAVKSRDSIRQIIDGNGSISVDRSAYILIQTPQMFQSALIRKAYSNAGTKEFTDDATIVEKTGHQLHLCDGEPWNMKITWPEDQIVVNSLLSMRNL